MAVENNYAIVIAKLSDWSKFFNQWEAKPKSIAPCTRDFSCALSKLLLIARNSDWFIALFAPVVIGRSNYYGFGLSTVIWKPLYLKPTYPHFALNLMQGLFSLCRWGLASGMISTRALLKRGQKKKTQEIFQKGVSNLQNILVRKSMQLHATAALCSIIHS